jgi:DHA1 family tetracycline resistance protein-like MFS transporter
MEGRLGWVILFVFIDVLGFSLILPLLPYYAQHFSASPSVIGLLLTSNAFAQMISAPFLGKLSDTYGRRPLLLICISGTVLSFYLLASAESVFELFLSRILDGILGGNISLAQTYISGINVHIYIF